MKFNPLTGLSIAAVAIAAPTIEPIEARHGGVTCNQQSSIAACCSTQTTQQPTQSVLAKIFPEGLTGFAQLLAQILNSSSRISVSLLIALGAGVLNPQLNTCTSPNICCAVPATGTTSSPGFNFSPTINSLSCPALAV